MLDSVSDMQSPAYLKKIFDNLTCVAQQIDVTLLQTRVYMSAIPSGQAADKEWTSGQKTSACNTDKMDGPGVLALAYHGAIVENCSTCQS